MLPAVSPSEVELLRDALAGRRRPAERAPLAERRLGRSSCWSPRSPPARSACCCRCWRSWRSSARSCGEVTSRARAVSGRGWSPTRHPSGSWPASPSSWSRGSCPPWARCSRSPASPSPATATGYAFGAGCSRGRGDRARRPRTGGPRRRGRAARAVRACNGTRGGRRLRRRGRGRADAVPAAAPAEVEPFLVALLPELADGIDGMRQPPRQALRRYVLPPALLVALGGAGALRLPRRRAMAASRGVSRRGVRGGVLAGRRLASGRPAPRDPLSPRGATTVLSPAAGSSNTAHARRCCSAVRGSPTSRSASRGDAGTRAPPRHARRGPTLRRAGL